MNPKLIALTGKRQCGKSVVGCHLKQAYGFQPFAFASILKKMLTTMGVPEPYVYGDKKEHIIPHLGVTGRKLMQTLGTEWGRKLIDNDIWSKALIGSPQFQSALLLGMPIVVDDLRFLNESKYLKELDFIIIRVRRPDSKVSNDGHQSEVELDLIKEDYLLYNNSTIRDLKDKTDELMRRIALCH